MPKANQASNESSKQPFVSQDDRPEVKISLDTPLSELRVRELSTIMGYLTAKNPNFEAGKTAIKDFLDKPWPEIAKDWLKEIKYEKFEKPEKPEKLEKLEKFEKPEKPELKELKLEKIESDGVFNPGKTPIPDPVIQQVIQAVAGLSQQVSQLANQLEELQKKSR